MKTDRRDAVKLARLHRSGELTAVWVPDEEQEAMRELTRAREDMKAIEAKARQRLGAFLLRHDREVRASKEDFLIYYLSRSNPWESPRLSPGAYQLSYRL